jgi:hypothetical protein
MKTLLFNLFVLIFVAVTVLSAPVEPTDLQIDNNSSNNNNNNSRHNINKRSPTFYFLNNNINYRQASWYVPKYLTSSNRRSGWGSSFGRKHDRYPDYEKFANKRSVDDDFETDS